MLILEGSPGKSVIIDNLADSFNTIWIVDNQTLILDNVSYAVFNPTRVYNENYADMIISFIKELKLDNIEYLVYYCNEYRSILSDIIKMLRNLEQNLEIQEGIHITFIVACKSSW